MSEATDVGVGLAGGAVLVGATQAAGLSAWETLAIGAGAGAVLALTPRARAGGLALLTASVIGAVVVSQSPRRRRAA